MSDRQIAWTVAALSIVGAVLLSSLGAWGSGWMIFIAVLITWGLLA